MLHTLVAFLLLVQFFAEAAVAGREVEAPVEAVEEVRHVFAAWEKAVRRAFYTERGCALFREVAVSFLI